MATPLATPLLDLGIENPNFFEGRLLTAAALRADQEANRARQRQLGRAIGAGVVEGLWVTLKSSGVDGSDPVVAISRGLAFNRKGQALEIAKEKQEIVLAAAAEADRPTDAGLFHPCSPSGKVAATGEGVYLLVLSPASGYSEETAPMSGLGTGTIGAGCGRRWAVEGVQLRLVALNPLTVSDLSDATKSLLQDELLAATDAPRLSKLRNVLAHLCFGTEALTRWPADPFATESGTPALASYGALDDLRAAGRLTDCDVPLALLYWTLSGVRFLDNWSVRRCPSPPACSDDWPSLARNRRRREGAATLFQFQDHLADLLGVPGPPPSVTAKESFRWLPAVGLLPLPTSGVRGVSEASFLQDITRRDPTPFMDGTRLRELLDLALDHPPIDLSAPEMIWTYQIRQNHPPPPAGSVNPYVVFASGFLPFLGTARFDVARWDRSNFGLL